jgi:hypothetical protein
MLRILRKSPLHLAQPRGGARRCAVLRAERHASAGPHAARSSQRISSRTCRNSGSGDTHMVLYVFRNGSHPFRADQRRSGPWVRPFPAFGKASDRTLRAAHSPLQGMNGAAGCREDDSCRAAGLLPRKPQRGIFRGAGCHSPTDPLARQKRKMFRSRARGRNDAPRASGSVLRLFPKLHPCGNHRLFAGPRRTAPMLAEGIRPL